MSARDLLAGGPPVPMTPLTPVTLSLLTNQQNPGVQAYTPRTRGLHAELQSWLSPLLGDGEPEELERKPPARLPRIADEDPAGHLLAGSWSPETRSESTGADPLNASQVTAEAALESLLRTVVDESDAKFTQWREGADLAGDLDALERDCDGRIKAACTQKMPSVKELISTMGEHIAAVRDAAAADAADMAAGYDAARAHMRSFGVDHLQAVWAEAEAARSNKAALNAQALASTIERVRESEGGAQQAARSAREAEDAATSAATRLEAEIAQLKEQVLAETTRADAAESALIKKFEQMDEISTASFQSTQRLLRKVDWLTGIWKAECGKSNRLEIALRKVKGEREAEEAKRRPPGRQEETPSEFSEKVKEMHKEADEMRGRVAQLVEHQNSIRNAILAIRRESTAARAFREAGAAVPAVGDHSAAGLAPSPPQSKPPRKPRRSPSSGSNSGGRKTTGGRQLSVAIPPTQAVGGSGRTAKRTPSWGERPSVRGGGGSDKPGSGSAARLQDVWQEGAGGGAGSGTGSGGQLASARMRRPALSLTSSRRLAG